ncbi:unnamed protein product [Aphis gossypii]|uniref:Uncharacterized protein n=1 Tax=Aphis gossypii TaxID=80765 RepID=A0A9P0IUP4_APHGO|nr:unnamed protein product [Aphis gossypii]
MNGFGQLMLCSSRPDDVGLIRLTILFCDVNVDAQQSVLQMSIRRRHRRIPSRLLYYYYYYQTHQLFNPFAAHLLIVILIIILYVIHLGEKQTRPLQRACNNDGHRQRQRSRVTKTCCCPEPTRTVDNTLLTAAYHAFT